MTASRWRPGDDRPDIASMIRVDQAGEYGATRIYAGQLAVLGDRQPASRTIARMALQEQRHLTEFDRIMIERWATVVGLAGSFHFKAYTTD